MNGNKSQVEIFYAAVAAKFGLEKPFSALSPVEIQVLCQAVSMILQVVRD